jgi:hypothetical protein
MKPFIFPEARPMRSVSKVGLARLQANIEELVNLSDITPIDILNTVADGFVCAGNPVTASEVRKLITRLAFYITQAEGTIQ